VNAIDALFHAMCGAGASDLHLSCGMPPLIRKDGGMLPLDPAAAPITPDAMIALLGPIMQEKHRQEFREKHDTDLVGEMRDLETVAIAIETAETGHLVFGTLHTTTAASTVDRNHARGGQPDSGGQDLPDSVDDAGRQGRRHGDAQRRPVRSGEQETGRAR
jgi:Tfp pilus assembly pilus retraction ATPase PilT